MGFSLGIVGLPNVGKSTLFNALTKAKADASNYPFCTIDPNIGIVNVPDERLEQLSKMSNSRKIVPTTIEFVDIAGLVEGASKGEGLGNKFLANIRQVNEIVHVVRCFENDNIVHVKGQINPKEDIEVINLELIMADLSTVERRIESLYKKVKGNDTEAKAAMVTLEKVKKALEEGTAVRLLGLNEKELEHILDLHLLSAKKVLYMANIDEESISNLDGNTYLQIVKKIADRENAKVIAVSSKIEAELAELEPEEAKEFLAELGLAESGLDLLIKTSYSLLDLITFLTTGEKESRAWTIRKGYKAPQAAGVIHTDFEKGFIKAEVISAEDLLKFGSYLKAREQGAVRQEGKEYVVQDGDVMVYKFNV